MDKLKPEWSVLSSCLNAVLQAGEVLGADPRQLISQVELDPSELVESDSRHPVSKLFALYHSIEVITGRQDVGLIAGRIDYINRLNLQLYTMSVCRTFREYLNLMPSAIAYEGDIGEIKVSVEKDRLHLNWNPLWDESRHQRYISDQMMTLSMHNVQSLCVETIPVLEASFTYAKPASVQALKKQFGSKLKFGQPHTRLTFDRACLDAPITQLYAGWHQPLSSSIQHLFRERPDDEFLGALRESLVRQMPTGAVSVEQIANELCLSPRTLQRRLSDRELKFQEVLQALRKELATQYLVDPHLSITDIAFLLGYSDQRSFTTAFKNWFDCSPRDYRQRRAARR